MNLKEKLDYKTKMAELGRYLKVRMDEHKLQLIKFYVKKYDLL